MPLVRVRPLTNRPLEEPDVPRKVTWLELFFDLVFVATISQVAQPLSRGLTPAAVAQFGAFFVVVWWAWLGQTTFATRFDSDDWLQRALTLAQMFVVAVMGVNAGGDLAGRDAAGFAAAYGALRLLLVVHYVRAHRLHHSRAITTPYLTGCTAAACLWLCSAGLAGPARFVLWALALAVDVATPVVAERAGHRLPPDEAHLPERFGLFTLILLGECVLSVMEGMRHQEQWPIAAASGAVTGLVVLFSVWAWYFERADVPRRRSVRSPADVRALHLWSYAHLPFYLGLILVGVGFERIIATSGLAPLQTQELRLFGAGAIVLVLSMVVLSRAVGPRPTGTDADAALARGARPRRGAFGAA